MASEKEPPELEAIQRQATGFSLATVTRVFYVIQREWRDEASRLYFLVRASVDLSGPYEQKDLDMIRTACCKGDMRHGPNLLSWALSFDNASSIGAQSELISKVQNAKLSSAPSIGVK